MKRLLRFTMMNVLLLGAIVAAIGGDAKSPPTVEEPQSPLAGEQVKRQVVAMGGVRGTSTNFLLTSALGQAAAGQGTSTNYKATAGYWPGQDAAATCKCGDADGNGAFSIADAVYLINYIFAGGSPPNPICRGDADGNGAVSIADAVYLINYIFASGPAPHCP